jgi:hypothetical protein
MIRWQPFTDTIAMRTRALQASNWRKRTYDNPRGFQIFLPRFSGLFVRSAFHRAREASNWRTTRP